MMMKAYQMMGVDQSAARYKATQHNRRHTCDELGICQCEGPACVPPGGNDNNDAHQAEEPPTPSPFEKMVDAIVVAALIGITIGRWPVGVLRVGAA